MTQTFTDALKFFSPDEDFTRAFARELAGRLRAGDVLGLVGDLGAGKTTFVQGLARGLGLPEDAYVTSPTFALLNLYPTTPPLAHFDLYRLGDADEARELGFDEYAGGEAVVVAEWFDLRPELHGGAWLEIRFDEEGAGRRLTLKPHGKGRPAEIIAAPFKVRA